jgi:hypothetical protein
MKSQQEFNKQEQIENLVLQAISKDLTYTYVLEEFKRNKWNLNIAQAEMLSNRFNVNMVKILFDAEDLNILNVDPRTKKALKLQRKYKADYQ